MTGRVLIALEDSDEIAEIELQESRDLDSVEQLLDLAFGPDRRQKTAYRLREHVDPLPELSFVVRLGGRLVGTLRFWPVLIKAGEGDETGVPALLLGPIAVDPALKGRGIGIGLMRHGLERARALGHRIVILVGDPEYYRRAGFSQIEPGRLAMPGPVDVNRLMGLELVPGAMVGVRGRISQALGS